MRAKPCASKIYGFEEFNFLNKKDRNWISKEIEINYEEIGEVEGIKIRPENYEKIYEIAERSMVGKNEKTVYDPEVRASREIKMERAEIKEEFRRRLQEEVDKISEKLEHPNKLIVKPFKIVCYKPGDFFKSHVDAVHEENMIMTLSVQFPFVKKKNQREYGWRNKEEGGNIVINKIKIPNPMENHVRLNLFYHDQEHKITTINEGYRISLVCDIIQEKDKEQKTPSYEEEFMLGIEKLREKSIKRIGFLTNYNYHGEISSDCLKGIDKVGYDLFKKVCEKVSIQHVCINDEKEIYSREILDVIQLDSSFHSLYHEIEESEESESESEENYKELDYENEEEEYDSYKDIKLNLDKENKYKAISKKYLLGDVIFLKTQKSPEMLYKGDEEIHLGNEGFYGEISTNLAVIGTLKQ